MRHKHREELVETRTEDGLVHAGLLLWPAERLGSSVGVVWIHGGGVNFYHPTFLRIGRELARAGLPFVTGNNRGDDFGTTLGWRDDGQAIRGGVGWEEFEQSALDVAAWVDLMAGLDVRRIALIGHSFGAPKVTYYQAQRQDGRVVGLGIASPPIRQRVEQRLVALAERMVGEGRGDDPLPWGSLPSIIGFPTWSARTCLSRARMPDLFGVERPDPPVAQIRCPIFACYGSADIGGDAELEIIRRNASRTVRLETAVFEGANHGYERCELAVAAALASWVCNLG